MHGFTQKFLRLIFLFILHAKSYSITLETFINCLYMIIMLNYDQKTMKFTRFSWLLYLIFSKINENIKIFLLIFIFISKTWKKYFSKLIFFKTKLLTEQVNSETLESAILTSNSKYSSRYDRLKSSEFSCFKIHVDIY